MKSLLTIGTLLIALAVQQLRPPPQTPTPRPAAPTAPPAPLSAAECKCSVDVTVKRQSNGTPISDAEITLTFNAPIPPPGATPAGPPARVVLTGKTDESGRANFPNLAEGTYGIAVRREGFFAAPVNGIWSPSAFTSANVGPAQEYAAAMLAALASVSNLISPTSAVRQPVQHVAVSMVEGSVISGRLLDANHRPAVGVPVTPMQISYQYGQRVLRPTAAQVQTDDLGQYRLFWFAPGEYYVATGLVLASGPRAGGPNFPSPTYYPGTLDLARARPIAVHEGEEASGTDFEMQSGGGVAISGTVTNTLPGRVNPNGLISRAISQVFLVPRNTNVMEPTRAVPNIVPAGNQGARGGDSTEFPFEIRGVPPGTYDLYPIFNDGATPRTNYYTGHVAIEVGSENVSGIRSEIQPGVDMKIHVSVTGTPPAGPGNRPAQPLQMQNVRMLLRPDGNLPILLAAGLGTLNTPDADGNISLTNLPEARFLVTSISGMPADGYVSEIRQGSRNIMDDAIINIGKETPDPLEVIISRGGSTISGTVEDAQHQPLTGTRVYLIPDMPRRRNLLLYKTSSSVQKGAFNFQGVAPGIYRVFAFDNIPQGAEQNDEFMSRYDGSGTRVVVNAGTPVTNVQVSLIQVNR
jgi:hypothetical protein